MIGFLDKSQDQNHSQILVLCSNFLFGYRSIPQQEPTFLQELNDEMGIFFRSYAHGFEGDFRVNGCLIRIIHTGEAFEFTAAGFGVQAFDIA